MTTIELDRTAIRRAALRAALRRGDGIGAARAWERLRVDGSGLPREEVRAARQARASVGRALRQARLRRAEPTPSPRLALLPAAALEGTWLRRRGAISTAAAFLLVFTLLFVIYPPRPVDEGFAPAAAAPELTELAQPDPTRAPTGARGRTSATLPPLVFTTAPPQPTPEPAATPAPTAARSGAPAATSAVGAIPGGAPGGVTGGVPSGTPGGVVGGVVGGTGKATPSPSPSVNVLPLYPPTLLGGADRFLFRVIDSRTGAPLSNVCVIYGTLTCGPTDPHTNLLGYFWLDLTPPAATNWSFRFNLAGYTAVTLTKTYRPRQGTVITTVDLRRR